MSTSKLWGLCLLWPPVEYNVNVGNLGGKKIEFKLMYEKKIFWSDERYEDLFFNGRIKEP